MRLADIRHKRLLSDDYRHIRMGSDPSRQEDPARQDPGEADFQVNTMAEACGITLAAMNPVLHFSRRQDMVAWPKHSLAGAK